MAYLREQDMWNARFGNLQAAIFNVQRTDKKQPILTSRDFYPPMTKVAAARPKKTREDTLAAWERSHTACMGGALKN